MNPPCPYCGCLEVQSDIHRPMDDRRRIDFDKIEEELECMNPECMSKWFRVYVLGHEEDE